MNSDVSKGGATASEPQAAAPETPRMENPPSPTEHPQNQYSYTRAPYRSPQAPYPHERRTSHWVPWVIGGILGMLALGGLVVALIIALVGSFFVSTINQREVSTSATQALTVTGTPSLIITDSAGNVTVQTGAVDKVVIQSTKRAWGSSVTGAQNGLSSMTVNVLQNGDTITVQCHFNTNGGVARRTVDLLVTVPAQANLDLHLGAGNIVARQMSGAIRLDTGAGNMTLENVTFSGNSRLNSGAGNIQATCALASASLVDVHVGAGNVTMTLPSDTPAQLDASTGVGNLTITGWHMSMMNSGMTGHHATGAMGANATGKMTIQVGTGNLMLIGQ